jgi:hypothetical protein
MNAASSIKPLLCLLAAGVILPARAEPLPIDAPFRATDVAFVRTPGDATVSGKAFLRLEDEHASAKQGGGAMKRIRVEDGSTQHVELRNP